MQTPYRVPAPAPAPPDEAPAGLPPVLAVLLVIAGLVMLAAIASPLLLLWLIEAAGTC